MVQVVQRALDAGVTPRRVLPGQFQDQFLDGRLCGWSAGFEALAGIVCLGDESPVPGQQGVGGDEAVKMVEVGKSDPFAFEGEGATLIIIEPGFPAELFFEDTDLFLEIDDDLLLVAVHPAGDRDDEQEERIHR